MDSVHSDECATAIHDEGPILNIKEAAKLMRCSGSLLYQQCQRGAIPHIRLGKRILFKREDILAWLDGLRRMPEEFV